VKSPVLSQLVFVCVFLFLFFPHLFFFSKVTTPLICKTFAGDVSCFKDIEIEQNAESISCTIGDYMFQLPLNTPLSDLLAHFGSENDVAIHMSN
jgi:hypothetical protein